MRVLYSFPDTLGAPGIGTAAYQQVRSLARLGVDVHVAATALAADPGVASTLTLTVAGRRVRHGYLGRDRAGALRAYDWHDRRVAALLRRRAGDFDVVHCWPQATLRTARRAHAAGVPVLRQAPSTHTTHAVETIRALHEALGVPMRLGDVHGHSSELVTREEAEYEAVDRILVPSDHAAATFVRRGVPASRLAVHRFGCDLERFRPDPGDRPVDHPLTILYAARGEPAKGLHHGLRAWRAAGAGASARLVLCGVVDDEFRRRFGDLLDDESIEERGFMSDLAPLMREADALLLPSLNEGSALVTYEAQASGCVLLVSDATGAPAEHMAHGLIHPAGDEAALTEHLRLLIADRELLARLRARVIADRDRLSWDAAAGGLVDAYRAATAGTSPPSA
jgi:glycosyltransferase involved in cell wall biosynthesis